MKKLVMTVALIACATVGSAQTVTSANIVGYSKVNPVGGELSLVALNFDAGSANTLEDLIGQSVPNLTWVYLWDVDAGAYESAQLSARGSWTPNLEVELGDAFWIQPAGSGTNEVVFSGEVLVEDAIVTLPAGVSMLGYGYPVNLEWQSTQMSSDLDNLSWVFTWDQGTQAYISAQKSARGSWTANPSIGVTEGFWVDNAGDQIDVAEPLPFTP